MPDVHPCRRRVVRTEGTFSKKGPTTCLTDAKLHSDGQQTSRPSKSRVWCLPPPAVRGVPRAGSHVVDGAGPLEGELLPTTMLCLCCDGRCRESYGCWLPFVCHVYSHCKASPGSNWQLSREHDKSRTFLKHISTHQARGCVASSRRPAHASWQAMASLPRRWREKGFPGASSPGCHLEVMHLGGS